MWDVFISHASEDKDSVARPLATALTSHRVSVWYDETTLRLGDSLRRSIDHGLANCRFGVVILSPQFFARNWTRQELEGMIARTTSSDMGILPVWHDVDKSEVLQFSREGAHEVSDFGVEMPA